jgi:hypothetical protein
MALALLTKMDVWMWVGPDERRLWTSSWGGRHHAVALAAWRMIAGLFFLGFQIWNWASSTDPTYFLSYLTEQGLWLTLSYFIIAAITGIAAIRASFKGSVYEAGVPPVVAGTPLFDVPAWHRALWMHTLRAQQMLFGIT